MTDLNSRTLNEYISERLLFPLIRRCEEIINVDLFDDANEDCLP